MLRAISSTPPESIIDDYILVPPIEAGEKFPDPEIIKWLRFNKVIYLGTGESNENAVPVRIDAPSDTSMIGRGIVAIRGKAQSEELISWSLSVSSSQGTNPENFQELISSEIAAPSGQLYLWDTTTIQSGPYILRLTVEDDFRGKIITESHVIITDETESLPLNSSSNLNNPAIPLTAE